MYIVCWMTKNQFSDWAVFDDLESAQNMYESMLDQDSTYTCTIAGVITSTDYDSI